MAQISITWQNGKPFASDTTVSGRNSTTITWVPDNTVTVSSISTPTKEGSSDFTAPSQVGTSANWQCTDNCDDNGDFAYTITGSQSSGGPQVPHDPKITNNRG